MLCRDRHHAGRQATAASPAAAEARPPPGARPRPGAEPKAYQRPHGSRAVTATAANSSVRYAIDRWNRRIGAVLSRGDDPPDPPALEGAARPPKPPWPAASAAATRVFSWWASTTN